MLVSYEVCDLFTELQSFNKKEKNRKKKLSTKVTI